VDDDVVERRQGKMPCFLLHHFIMVMVGQTSFHIDGDTMKSPAASDGYNPFSTWQCPHCQNSFFVKDKKNGNSDEDISR
jgi:hypothetical protein